MSLTEICILLGSSKVPVHSGQDTSPFKEVLLKFPTRIPVIFMLEYPCGEVNLDCTTSLHRTFSARFMLTFNDTVGLVPSL